MTDRDGLRPRHAEALEELASQRPEMVRWATSNLRKGAVPQSWADPQEIVQNAFEAVLANNKPIDNVRAYVRACMLNEIKLKAKDYARRGHASLDADVRLQDRVAVQPIDEFETLYVITSKVVGLSEQQRKVTYAKYLGMTHSETAQILDIAPQTVGVHWHRARRALYAALVGLVGALAVLTTWGTAFVVREIIPAAGGEWPVDLPAAPSLTTIQTVIYFYGLGALFVLMALAAVGAFGPKWKEAVRDLFREGWPDSPPDLLLRIFLAAASAASIRARRAIMRTKLRLTAGRPVPRS